MPIAKSPTPRYAKGENPLLKIRSADGVSPSPALIRFARALNTFDQYISAEEHLGLAIQVPPGFYRYDTPALHSGYRYFRFELHYDGDRKLSGTFSLAQKSDNRHSFRIDRLAACHDSYAFTSPPALSVPDARLVVASLLDYHFGFDVTVETLKPNPEDGFLFVASPPSLLVI